MKTIKFPLILIILASAFCAFGETQNKKTLVIAGDDWCPYNCRQGAKDEGFLVELARKAFYIYGIDVEYRVMSWSQALEEVSMGNIDAIFGVSNPNISKLVSTKLPIEYSISRAYTKEGSSWIYDGIGSLRGKKLGIILDYEVDESINQYIGSNYAKYPSLFAIEEGVDAVAKSINNLNNKQIEVFIEDERVVKYYTKNMNLTENIKNAGRVSKVKLPIYIAFSSKTNDVKKYISRLEEGIASLKATGEYNDLRRKYDMD